MAFAAMVGFLGNGYAIPCRGVYHIKAIVWRTLFYSEAKLPPEARVELQIPGFGDPLFSGTLYFSEQIILKIKLLLSTNNTLYSGIWI